MNPKEVFHNTAYSVQLPYIAGHSLLITIVESYDFLNPLIWYTLIGGIGEKEEISSIDLNIPDSKVFSSD